MADEHTLETGDLLYTAGMNVAVSVKKVISVTYEKMIPFLGIFLGQ